MSALVLADHDNLSVSPATLSAITAAQQMSASIHVLVTGNNCAAVADALSKTRGVEKVFLAQSELLANQIPENVAPVLLKLASDYEYIVAPASSNGKNILPRVAAVLDVSQVSEITAVVSPDTFERPTYAGNAIAIVRSNERPKLITVRATRFSPAEAGEVSAPIEELAFDRSGGGSRFVENRTTRSDRPDLATASVVVSGGRGIGSKENFELLASLADRLNAAVGASRAAVDAGFAPSDSQVGQTGKVVAPDLYVAIGISGAIQHLAGMKDSKVIVAINKDAEAPIFNVADIGFVGDFLDVVPKLTVALSDKATV